MKENPSNSEMTNSMPKKAYITMLGRSTWALVNSYYALLRERRYFPDSIFVFTEKSYENELEKATNGLETLSKHFGFQFTIHQEVIEEAILFGV